VIGVFKQKSPGNIVLLLFFGLAIKIPIFLYPKTIKATDKDGELYHAFLSLITPANGNNAMICSFVSFLLIYVQALMLNYLLNEYRMTARPTYLPAMSYMLITSLLPEWTVLSSPLVASTFVIWMFILLFRLYNMQVARGTIYNIGLIAGISSYIFFPSSLFVICILLGIMILKPFRLNEIVLFIMGCLTPYYFYAIYLYLTDQFSLQALFPHIDISTPTIKSSIWLAISTILLTVPFLIGGYYIQANMRKMLIQVRKNWSILLFYLMLAIFLPYINNAESFDAWVLAAAPFAAFHASAFYYPTRKLLPMTIFILVTGFILFQQYATKIWH
jgi:hypothetical protein